MSVVDRQRVGSLLRAVRRRRGLRQIDVAAVARVSDSTVSLVERGHWQTLSLETVERIASALDVRLDVVARWRGGDGDRLLSRAHSRLAEQVAGHLRESGWAVEPEVSFSIYGERGVIDQLAWHPGRSHLLVLELKTEFVDVNEMLGTFDRKIRLARAIAGNRGWHAARVSGWLIVLETRTNRRHSAEHRALLRSRFPRDGRALAGFLADPGLAVSGMAFWPDSSTGGVGPTAAGGRSRIRVGKSSGGPSFTRQG
jgi:transcriptional regulator with XRE-family HTH domain